MTELLEGKKWGQVKITELHALVLNSKQPHVLQVFPNGWRSSWWLFHCWCCCCTFLIKWHFNHVHECAAVKRACNVCVTKPSCASLCFFFSEWRTIKVIINMRAGPSLWRWMAAFLYAPHLKANLSSGQSSNKEMHSDLNTWFPSHNTWRTLASCNVLFLLGERCYKELRLVMEKYIFVVNVRLVTAVTLSGQEREKAKPHCVQIGLLCVLAINTSVFICKVLILTYH